MAHQPKEAETENNCPSYRTNYGCNDRTDNLRNDVHDAQIRRHASRQHERDGHGRIEMCGDAHERRHHDAQRETVRDRDLHESAVTRRRQHDRRAADEDECENADEFGVEMPECRGVHGALVVEASGLRPKA